MSTRSDNDVTLAHGEAEAIAKMLSELAIHYADSARKSRSQAVRTAATQWSQDARKQSDAITKRLWTWA
jgi:hypothetical protein